MRLTKLWIDGYGRFLDREIPLAPGLQVIIGPNEQGKSTIRCFIGDMLYGQKRSLLQRSYDESNASRQPWLRPEPYGGRLRYLLDNGSEYEVHRRFDLSQDSVQVFDCRLGKDVTGEFDRLRNREVNFAERHLGLSKAVFLSTATISHLSVDGLGDEGAVSEIKERLLALADAAEEGRTAQAAIEYLTDRIKAIGQPAARTRPLPAARARLAELNNEHAALKALHADLEELEMHRASVRETRTALLERRALLESQRAAVEYAAAAESLMHAESVQAEIDRATQTLFQLSAVRDFDLDSEPELQRLRNAVNTAQTQVTRSERERIDADAVLAREREALGPLADTPVAEVPETQEQRLAELEQGIARLTERYAQLSAEAASAQRRLDEAEGRIAEYPDFETLGDDPAETLGRMGAELARCADRVAAEVEKRVRLESDRAALAARMEKPRRVFERFRDFPTELGEYRVATRLHEDRSEGLRRQIGDSGLDADRHAARLAVQRSIAVATGVSAAALLLAAAWMLQSQWVGPAAGVVCGVGGLLSAMAAGASGVLWAATKSNVASAEAARKSAEAQLNAANAEVEDRRKALEDAAAAAGFTSIRELEAYYERYLNDQEDLRRVEFAILAERNRLDVFRRELEDQFPALRKALRSVGAEPQRVEDVPQAIRQAVARYHEYRDARRRSEDYRPVPAHLRAQADRVRSELEDLRREERDLALRVREHMRQRGFREETRHTSVLKAVRAYHARCGELREKQSRLRAIGENVAVLRDREESERRELQGAERRLRAFLDRAAAQTVDDWLRMANRAREYRAAWDRRGALQDRLEAILRGRSIDELREAVEVEPPEPSPQGRSLEDLSAQLAEVAQALETSLREDHDLQVRIAQRAAGSRSLSEVEEERSEVAYRVEQLSLELDAAAHAAAIIEEVASDRHARIAPHLQAIAGGYWRRITGGAYDEIVVGRDLSISVRVPQTRQLQAAPEQRLSKGTVDQLYLAVRLALVAVISKAGERTPIILDDPFAHYDGDRLQHAMALLAEVSESHQLLLFTCHYEVAREAEAVGAPVIRL